MLTGMDIQMELINNLICSKVDFDVYVNGKKAGSFVVMPSENAVNVSFRYIGFSRDGLATIKYLVTNTVTSGCGSIAINCTSSIVTFKGLII